MNSTARVETVQQAIERKNRETAAGRRKLFGKKANDQQHHENLLKHCEVVMEIYHKDSSLRNDNNFRAAMRELEASMSLSRKKLQP